MEEWMAVFYEKCTTHLHFKYFQQTDKLNMSVVLDDDLRRKIRKEKKKKEKKRRQFALQINGGFLNGKENVNAG